jgi:hypothetical protein
MRAYLDAMNAWILACAMRSNPLALACAIHLHAQHTCMRYVQQHTCLASEHPTSFASNILRIIAHAPQALAHNERAQSTHVSAHKAPHVSAHKARGPTQGL